LLREFQALAKSVPAGAKFGNTPAACGGDRNFEDFTSLFLIINFDWPKLFEAEHGKKARALHDTVLGKSRIKEAVAASGGIGAGSSSVWILCLENYAALDRLLKDEEDLVAQAYRSFFSEMVSVEEQIRQEVIFLDAYYSPIPSIRWCLWF